MNIYVCYDWQILSKWAKTCRNAFGKQQIQKLFNETDSGSIRVANYSNGGKKH